MSTTTPNTTTPNTTNFHDLGQARLDAIQQVKSQEDWERLWPKPQHEYPFEWGTCWKQCTQYCVQDYAAEVGFWIDAIGLSANAFGPEYAMFTSPDKAFYFGVVPADSENQPTPTAGFNLGFMIEDLPHVAEELERRGVHFTRKPAPWAEGGPLLQATLRTPNDVEVMLWSMPA